MAAINISLSRIVFLVSILCHFMRIAVPKNACPSRISEKDLSTREAGRRTVYREETPAAAVISDVTAITFPT